MNLAACRSATLRSKIVMRFGCCLVAASLAMSCFAMPRAKAVVSETALLGSIFGSLLVSLGYSWAAENMDVPTFGESIYKLIQEHDEANKDTGVQLLRDLNIAALTSGRPGTIQFNYAWTQAARSFAEWFQDKFGLVDNSSATVVEGGSYFTLSDGTPFYFRGYDGTSLSSSPGSKLSFEGQAEGSKIYLSNGSYFLYQKSSSSSSRPGIFIVTDTDSKYFVTGFEVAFFINDSENPVYAGLCDSALPLIFDKNAFPLSYLGDITNASNLAVEKPAEVHYPDVAEDGSEVYEVTYQGVTATDIEGIIQGAVDQILAGTASIAGEVTQAQDVPAEPEVPPELDGLDLPALGAALTSRFPFSIPWDVARGISLLAAPAEAPYWEVDFLAPISYRVGGWEGSTTVVLDFSEFEILGQLSRWMSTIGFCLMLAASTKRLIWVA